MLEYGEGADEMLLQNEWTEFRAPGRTELLGNHTDHQHGKVLAMPVPVYIHGKARLNGRQTVNIMSEGFDTLEINLADLGRKENEKGTTAGLVRGILSQFREKGAKLAGFEAQITSELVPGGGLSSSAAFEILIARICNRFFCQDGILPKELARIGQYAENCYYGKPSGLMDQMACAYEQLIYIDFQDAEDPIVEPIDFDFRKSGYELFFVDSGASHENLTADYAQIPEDLREVCRVFGKEYLRDVTEEEFYLRIDEVREKTSERAANRAIHVYNENLRVENAAKALKNNDIEGYLRLVEESGESSWNLLQNIVPASHPENTKLAETILRVKKELGSQGVVRVHGGGFAGLVQAYRRIAP